MNVRFPPLPLRAARRIASVALIGFCLLHSLEAAGVERWEYRLPGPKGDRLRSVAFDGEKFVAVGDAATILVSYDGHSWEPAEVAPAESLRWHHIIDRVVFTGGHWFALGNTFAYSFDPRSSDGIHWNAPETNTNRRPLDVVFLNGLYYQIQEGGYMRASPTPVPNSMGTQPSVVGQFTGLTAGGGRLVVVGAQGFIMSRAGGSWIREDVPVSVDLADVEYFDGAFYAFGAQGTILRSTEAGSWTLVHQEGLDPIAAMTQFNGRLMAVGGSGRVLVSEDGQTWSSVTLPTQAQIFGIAAGNGVVVVVGECGLRMASEDGVTWSGGRPWISYSFIALASNGQVVTSQPDVEGRSVYSRDGVTWLPGSAPAGSGCFGVVSVGGAFYAGGEEGVNLRSTDGTSWQPITTAVAPGIQILETAGPRGFAVPSSGSFWTTENGTAWTPVTLSSGVMPRQFAHGNGVFLAATGAVPFRSADGLTWNPVLGAPALNTVTFGNNKFVGTAGYYIYESSDGALWNVASGPHTEGMARSVWTGEEFLMLGGRGPMLRSTDGTTWTSGYMPIGVPSRGALSFKGQVLAFGENQIIHGIARRPERGLSNISTRARIVGDSGTLIAGFVLQGGSKPLLIRGAGTSIGADSGLPLLDDPRMTVFSAGAGVAENDDWGLADDPSVIAARAVAVGAFDYIDGSREAALAITLPAAAYTPVIDSASGNSGIALAEVYDADNANTASRLVNISTRGAVATGDDVMIAGFVVPPGPPMRLLVRAVGPSLGLLGVGDAISDPKLTVFSGSTAIAENDNWSSSANSAQMADAAVQWGAFELPHDSKDAAVMLYLSPGPYTAIVEGVGGDTGTALVEVYLLE